MRTSEANDANEAPANDASNANEVHERGANEPANESGERELWIGEVAERLRLSTSTVRRLVRDQPGLLGERWTTPDSGRRDILDRPQPGRLRFSPAKVNAYAQAIREAQENLGGSVDT